jgi:hypothetical protein
VQLRILSATALLAWACGSTEASRTRAGGTLPGAATAGAPDGNATTSGGGPSGVTAGAAPTGGTGTTAGGAETVLAGAGPSAGGTAGTPAGGAPSPPKDWTTAGALLVVTFDDSPLGNYSKAQVAKDFGAPPPWDDGLTEGRVSVSSADGAYSGRGLRVHYPAGGVGPSEGGAQFLVPLAGNHQELYCAYRIRFESKFDFVKGGKIPGLSGGNHPTGCSGKPSGSDGFTARMMWREGGAAVQYVYYPDQAEACGDDFAWNVGQTRAFKSGQWYSLEHHVVLNTGDQANGVMQAWFDGELALDRKDVRFRSVDSVKVDSFYFSTFFGGSGADWAPPADEYVDFDDVVVSERPITH